MSSAANAGTITSTSKPATLNKKPIAPPNHTATAKAPAPPKKVNHRSSKPLLHWFQRKLAGTSKSKRENGHVAKGRNSSPIPMRPTSRVVSTPLPSASVNGLSQHRTTISLNGDSIMDRFTNRSNDDLASTSDDRSSVARDSMWSPTSGLEADDDASMRPIPPSSPPSPSPSRSSSSYLSNPRTFRSMAASTKPTTLLSIDLHGNGMAHIAQAPVTPTSHRFSHARNPSTSTNPMAGPAASVTFSALPPSPGPDRTDGLFPVVQAPLHTTHHPRNNPRPSSPPLDNASMLTLASSAYAHPGLRPGAITPGYGSAPPSAIAGTDTYSQYGGSMYAESGSQYPLGDDALDERDVDASVRALRPRSSRRGSWESEVSRWSARIQVGTPSLVRERSLWTTNSVRTGGDVFDNDKSDEGIETEVECVGTEAASSAEPTPTGASAGTSLSSPQPAAVKPEDVPLPPDSPNA